MQFHYKFLVVSPDNYIGHLCSWARAAAGEEEEDGNDENNPEIFRRY